MAFQRDGRGVNAIVVDDNKDVLAVFAELLQIHGVDVVGRGTDGKQALELYRKHHPDILFIDAHMGAYNGFWGIEKIREYDPDAKVVLVTGSIDVEDKVMCCSATAVVAKPIDMKKVMKIVNEIVISSDRFLSISQ